MIILGLDVATSTGWAVYDTDKHPSAMECGTIDLSLPKEIKGDKRRKMMRGMIDEQVCKLFDRYRPDVACIEQPLNYIKTDQPPKPKKFRGQATMFGAHCSSQSEAKKGKDKGGPNADTVLLLNQIFAVAATVCQHKASLTVEVPPKTWQALTSSYAGDTKERSINFCSALKIVLPGGLNKKERGDAADACVIAFWAAGHCQELKLLERARAA